MKRTRRQALALCEEMWRTLSKTGNSSKLSALGTLGETRGDWDEFVYTAAECFACEYHKEHLNQTCLNCICTKIWNVGNKKTWIADCAGSTSPYYRWNQARTTRTRKKYAKIIADGCLKLLKELK